MLRRQQHRLGCLTLLAALALTSSAQAERFCQPGDVFMVNLPRRYPEEPGRLLRLRRGSLSDVAPAAAAVEVIGDSVFLDANTRIDCQTGAVTAFGTGQRYWRGVVGGLSERYAYTGIRETSVAGEETLKLVRYDIVQDPAGVNPRHVRFLPLMSFAFGTPLDVTTLNEDAHGCLWSNAGKLTNPGVCSVGAPNGWDRGYPWALGDGLFVTGYTHDFYTSQLLVVSGANGTPYERSYHTYNVATGEFLPFLPWPPGIPVWVDAIDRGNGRIYGVVREQRVLGSIPNISVEEDGRLVSFDPANRKDVQDVVGGLNFVSDVEVVPSCRSRTEVTSRNAFENQTQVTRVNSGETGGDFPDLGVYVTTDVRGKEEFNSGEAKKAGMSRDNVTLGKTIAKLDNRALAAARSGKPFKLKGKEIAKVAELLASTGRDSLGMRSARATGRCGGILHFDECNLPRVESGLFFPSREEVEAHLESEGFRRVRGMAGAADASFGKPVASPCGDATYRLQAIVYQGEGASCWTYNTQGPEPNPEIPSVGSAVVDFGWWFYVFYYHLMC